MPTALSTLAGGQIPLWVSGATYKQYLSVVRSPTDQQLYLRRTNGAGTVDPATDTTNWMPEGPRARKSLQRVYVGYYYPSGTATIAAVNPDKCLVTHIGAVTSNYQAFESGLITLTATSVTVARGANVSGSLTTGVQIEEFY